MENSRQASDILSFEYCECPGCKKKLYHSEICLYNDLKHFSICTVSVLKNKFNRVVSSGSGLDPKIFLFSKAMEIDYGSPLGSGGFATVRAAIEARIIG